MQGVGKQPISRSRHDELQRELRDAEARVRAFRDAEGSSGWSDAAAGAQIDDAIAPLIRRVLELERLLRTVVPVDDGELKARARAAAVDRLLARAQTEAAVFRLEIADVDGLPRAVIDAEGPIDPAALAHELTAAGESGEFRVVRVADDGTAEKIVFRQWLNAGKALGGLDGLPA
jgi:hypothetical protein